MSKTLEQLEALARGAKALNWSKDAEGWVQDCDKWEAQDYIAAASPDVILRLVEIAKAAERLMRYEDEGAAIDVRTKGMGNFAPHFSSLREALSKT